MKKSILVGGGKIIRGPAMLWKRLGAFIADVFILEFFILSPFQGLINAIMPDAGMMENYNFLVQNPASSNMIFIIILSMAFLSMLYFIIFEYRMGQTIGKMLFGIYVESTENGLNLWQIIVRQAWLIPIIPFILLWVIDPAYIMFKKDGVRLSEQFSRTRSVQYFKY